MTSTKMGYVALDDYLDQNTTFFLKRAASHITGSRKEVRRLGGEIGMCGGVGVF
jgi:hypothetical protein